MKTVSFPIEQIYPAMVSVLNSGGEFRMIANGTSMKPFLRNSIDTIVLIKHGSKLNKFDVPLYRRKDGSFVLHRIVGKNKDGYILCGDNQFKKEYGVSHDDIIAVLKGFEKDGKYTPCTAFSYKCYYVFWHYSRPVRYILRRLRVGAIIRKIKRIAKRIIKK